MNILHLKYAVEIAKAGSINKASEALRMGQPNLSRAIKELELSLGITIFERSARGMVVTAEGEEFLAYARNILKQIDELKSIYKPGHKRKQKFTLSIPDSAYINRAVGSFSALLTDDPAEICCSVCSIGEAIKNIVQSESDLAVIRYSNQDDHYFKTLLEEKSLSYELVAEFAYEPVMSAESPLASLDSLKRVDLVPYIELFNGELFSGEDKREESETLRKFRIDDRACRLELLAENPDAFMWDCPIPADLLERYGLVQKKCADSQKNCKDLLIYRSDYTLTALDKSFITELCNSRRSTIR